MRLVRSRPVLIVAACTAVALFWAAQNVLGRLAAHTSVGWEWSVLHPVVYWLAWAPFVPLVLWMSDRFRLERAGAGSVVARHATAMLGVAPLQSVTAFVAHWAVVRASGAVPTLPALRPWLGESWPSILWATLAGFVYYWAIVGFHHAYAYQRLYQAQRLAGVRLEADLADARLRALTAQLQPHFLFNTLNSIAVLAEDDPPRSAVVVRQLAELLRATLDRTRNRELPLGDEIALTRRYLEIQQARFGDRLRVCIDVDAAALGALVPALLLQPLVENAIRHSVEMRETGGEVAIHARHAGDTLLLEVADDGPGLDGDRVAAGTGVGLPNTRARLAQLYGERHRFALDASPRGGLTVRIELPLHTVDGTRMPAASDV